MGLVSAPASPLAVAGLAGLQDVRRELGAAVIVRSETDEAGQRQALRELGGAGLDVVFCVGDGIADVVYSEAPASPNTAFVVLDGVVHGGNIAGAVFRAQEGGFLAGVLAAHAGGGGPPGVLLEGRAGPWDDALAKGFVEGFRNEHPGVMAVRGQGPGAATELAAAGVTIALAPANLPGAGMLERCREAGVTLVPARAEPLTVLPEGVAAVVVVNVPEAMLRIAREVRVGQFRGGTYGFDLGSGVVDLVVNPAWSEARDPVVRQALDDARAGITAGIVEVEQLGIGTG